MKVLPVMQTRRHIYVSAECAAHHRDFYKLLVQVPASTPWSSWEVHSGGDGLWTLLQHRFRKRPDVLHAVVLDSEVGAGPFKDWRAVWDVKGFVKKIFRADAANSVNGMH